MSTIELWRQLQKNKRHHLRYPSEHVVRWLATLDDLGGSAIALDIGCGHGRHLTVFQDFGIAARGIDIAVQRLRPPPRIDRADMRDLPFLDDFFDYALAYGVFYYGTRKDHDRAVSELHRVLREGGEALIVTRTARDSRLAHGEDVGSRTVRVRGGDEQGMLMNFLVEEDIPLMYAAFPHLHWERTETTRLDGSWLDSDWLIRVQK